MRATNITTHNRTGFSDTASSKTESGKTESGKTESGETESGETESGSNPQLEQLLVYLRENRGFDFTGYKRASLERRVRRRMQDVQCETFEEYIDYLEVHPEEFTRAFNSILINVTGFFRDAQAWDYLARQIVPQLLDGAQGPIRIWSAGCASGEEAYSLAILLAEALSVESFRERVKIYATDVDEDALAFARRANYTEKQVNRLPGDLIEKYFVRSGEQYVFQGDLRRSVIFGRHDLVQDAPISRIDLLACRNTLMYFNSEVQARILDRFHFSLNEGGWLFLGKAEMMLSHKGVFQPVDLRRRVFAKLPRGSMRDRLLAIAQGPSDWTAGGIMSRGSSDGVDQTRLLDAALDADPSPLLVVSLGGYLSMANERARTLLGLDARDLGRPLRDLEAASPPMRLAPHIEQACIDRRTIVVGPVDWFAPNGDRTRMEIQIVPVLDTTGIPLGAKLCFVDVTRATELEAQLRESRQELEDSRSALDTAYRELQATNEELETMNEELQAAIEEMETTNEELQSTVEELETTNEELQSTNEELETMNEELQSTNEELETMNEAVRQRGDEVNQINAFLESILTSLRAAVVVLNRDLRVEIWSARAEDLWGLRSEEVQGRNFLTLDIGLPVEELRRCILTCTHGTAAYQEVTLNAINRRGKSIRCRVSCTPLLGADLEIWGVILLMEEVYENSSADGAVSGAADSPDRPDSSTLAVSQS